MSPRKPLSQLTPEQTEARRKYWRDAKAKSRLGKPPERDNRGYRNRSEYQRDYRARKKAEKQKIKQQLAK